MFSDYIDSKKAPDISPDAFTRAFNHPHNEQLKYFIKVADLNAQSQALPACSLEAATYSSVSDVFCTERGVLNRIALIDSLSVELSPSCFRQEGFSPCHVKEVCDSDLLNMTQDNPYNFCSSLSIGLSDNKTDSCSLNASLSAQDVFMNKPGCPEILYGNSQKTHDAIEDKVQLETALRLSYNRGGMFRHAPFYSESIDNRLIDNSFDDSFSASSSEFLYRDDSLDSRDGSTNSPACPIGNTSRCDRTSTRFVTSLEEDSFLTLFETREGCQSALFFQESVFKDSSYLQPDISINTKNKDQGFADIQISACAFDDRSCSEILYGNSQKTHDAIEDRVQSPSAFRLSYNLGSMFRHAPFYKKSATLPNPTIY